MIFARQNGKSMTITLWRMEKIWIQEIILGCICKIFSTKSVLEKKTVHLDETKIQAGAFGPGLWRKFLPRRCAIPEKSETYRV
ncbi:hypothetical protein [Gemmiger sp.]|uniref:hypothetical protein n=1 Tax=Gemmiger sp. TaxID=2049027 RepID=UPI003A8E9142